LRERVDELRPLALQSADVRGLRAFDLRGVEQIVDPGNVIFEIDNRDACADANNGWLAW
jgi:hypothetical protein